MKLCLLVLVGATVMNTAQAVVFDCVADQVLQSNGREFSVVKVRQRTQYAVDTDSGIVSDGADTWRYRVLERGDPKVGRDWVLLYLPENVGPSRSAEDVLRQLPFSGRLRIRVWRDSNPFILDRGGILELGSCWSHG
jgi:hypothetical protein